MQFSRITKKKKSHLYASQDYSQNPPCTAAGAHPLHAVVQYSHFFLCTVNLMAKAFIVLNNLVSHIYIYMHLYNVYIYINAAIAIAIHLIKALV